MTLPGLDFLARQRLAALGLLLALGAPAQAAHTPVRELERLVSDHPHNAVRQAEAWLAQAARTRDLELGLKAQRLLTMAWEAIEDSERLRRAADKGLELARELKDREAEAELTAARAGAESLDGNHAEALRTLDEAARLADLPGHEHTAAKVAIARAHVEMAQGRIAEAVTLAVRAYGHFESARDSEGMSNALSAMANIYSRESSSPADLQRAADYHQRALDLAGPGAGRWDRATDLFNLGSVHLRLKAYDKARGYLEKCLALSRELEDQVGAAYAHHRLGVLEKEQGRPAQALALQDKALAVFTELGDRMMEFRVRLARAEVLALLDRRREALESLAGARALAERIKSPRMEGALHESSSEILARFGDWQGAYRDLRSLREAEKRRDDVARNEQATELQARFDLKQKDAENALLRLRETESEARRLVLVLSLVLSLVVLGGLSTALAAYVMRHRRMASLALRDDLTGLPNRRSILEYGRLHVRRNRKGGEGLTVALIDLDHFKSINDEFGHAVGDVVLKAFADASIRQLRTQDRLGRFGGEEFLLVMPGADLEQIPYVFERLRKAYAEAAIPGVTPGRTYTFSLGAAEARSVADDLESLIQRADRALYRAKHSGRDRFETG